MTLPLAQQLTALGTETAFAVAAQAAAWQAQGNKVYPYHLGDVNIMPPQELLDGVATVMRSGKNTYCPGAGVPLLREQLAEHFGQQRGVSYTADNVAVQPGGKPVIAKFLLAVMNPGEEVLTPVPGFPIYESQIRYQRGVPVPYHYRPQGGRFVLDVDAIARAIGSNTRAIIFNNHHNPTGAVASAEELDALAALAVKHNLWVLNDEAYYLIRYGDTAGQSILTRAGMMERTINLFTFSKQFAMTGWRLGAAIGPAEAIAAIATMNTNLESCTTHFIQQAMGEALAAGLADAPCHILPALTARRDALVARLNAISGVTVHAPPAGFYVYCDLAQVMRRKHITHIATLLDSTLRATGVSFCSGAHFGERADTTFARFAFSGISEDDIHESGAKLKTYFESAA